MNYKLRNANVPNLRVLVKLRSNFRVKLAKEESTYPFVQQFVKVKFEKSQGIQTETSEGYTNGNI